MSHVIVALVLLVMSGRGADSLTAAQAQAIKDWVTAVRSHTAGRRDAGAGRIASLTFEQRTELQAGMPLFLAAVQGKKVLSRNQAEKQVLDLATETKVNPGADAFFKRAAVLHSDVAVQNRIDDAKPVEGGVDVPSSSEPPPPLLSRQRHILDKDGEILGEVMSDWNWPFARSLLDLIFPKPADDPFVGTWYHATAAFMLRQGLYAEVFSHLARAAVVLPDDPFVLFDRAAYAEIQGLPVVQVLLSDDDVLTIRARREGRASSLIRTPERGGNNLNIPLAIVTNEEAERLFRRALRADASLVEARVRLGRLLIERKRHEEAAAELVTALAAKPEGPVAFYAHLFAGRAAQALGKIDDAAAHYKEAGALYPGAQSALLAQSQAALLAADTAGAAEPIHHLEQLSLTVEAREDPWWKYHLAAGRDTDVLLRVMWKKVLEP
jgi:tetratricopeptide (TPR) repeat protein